MPGQLFHEKIIKFPIVRLKLGNISLHIIGIALMGAQMENGLDHHRNRLQEAGLGMYLILQIQRPSNTRTNFFINYLYIITTFYIY